MMIRPIEASDYPAFVTVRQRVYPTDVFTAEEFAALDVPPPAPCLAQRFVGMKEDKLIGSAYYRQHPGMYHPGVFHVGVFVDPEYQNQGIGTRLYQHLLDALKPLDATTLLTQVEETHEAAIHFAKTRGFVEQKRDWEAVLDVQTFNPEPYQAHLQKVRDAGIEILPFSQFIDDEKHQRAFYELHSEVRQDVPRSMPVTPFSFEYFKETFLKAPDFKAENTFLALKDGQFIGTTTFYHSEATTDLYTGLTAVKRAFRGAGIATALKVTALTHAKNSGASNVYTDNDTRNTEMIRVNDKLGFKRLPAFISVKANL